jgi:pimeloyl-ACP methyl ester carboxylesterase
MSSGLPGADIGDRLTRRRITVNGVELAVVDEGSGPAVLLLHGWPDSADLWRRQIPELVAAGYRVIAPDLRGFGASDKPSGVAAYRVRESVADMAALLRAAGIDRADVIAHDWGAAVAWLFATRHADATRRLVALSVGHPSTFGAPDADGRPPLAHLRRQWYALLFQFADVAEQWLSADDWRCFRALVGSAEDTDRYIADLSRPGALTAGLNWYRANSPLRAMLANSRSLPPVAAHVGVLGVWSDGDQFLMEQQMTDSAAHVAGQWRYERVSGAGHWMQLDEPHTVTRLVLDHLGA